MSLAALPSVECRCTDLRRSYLQQTVQFFQSDTHTAIPNKLAFTSLHCSISNYTLKGLRSDKPSHKHDPNKYPPGGILKEFLGGDVPLGPWNPWPLPELVQLNFATLY